MSDSTHNAILKLLAAILGLFGLIWFFGGFGAEGIFAKLFSVLLGLVTIVAAAGFWKMRGWAFLMVSVGLLIGFMVKFIQFLISFDTGVDTGMRAAALLVNIALIGYLGRWSMERRFRPNA